MRRKVRDRTKFQVNLNIFKVLSILLIIIFIFFTPALIQKLIVIKKVECVSQFGACPDELVYSISYIVNRDYRATKKYITETLNKDLQVNDFLIQYKIPSTIKIELNLKKPHYAIKNKQSLASSAGSESNFYLISLDGVVVKLANESSLPQITRDGAKYNLGDRILKTDDFALKVVEKVSAINEIEQSIIDSSALNIKLKDSVVVLFPLEGDTDVLSGSLRLIFSRLNAGEEGIRMEDIHEIDLRFSNPILR